MADYSFEKKLTSYSVNRAFLKDAESFIRKKAEDLQGQTYTTKDCEISIQDSLGTQTLPSIDEYHYSQFPNDTTSIRLEYHGIGKVRFRFELRLHISADLSSVKVFLSGDTPRQHVLGIWAELEHLLDTYKTNHYLWALNPAIVGPFALILFLISLVTSISPRLNMTWAQK